MFGAQTGATRARNDKGPDGLAGSHFTIESGAAEVGNKGKNEVSGRETGALIDPLGLIPALNELAFDGIAFLVVVGERTDLKPGKFLTEFGGRRIIGKPTREDRGKGSLVGCIETKELALIPVEDGLGKIVARSEVNVGRAFVGVKPEVGDPGAGNAEYVAGRHRDIGGRGEDLALLPVDEAELTIERIESDAFEPVPDGIHSFRAQGRSPGGDPSSVLFEEGEVLWTADLETAHPAGSVAQLSGTSPLDASASEGDLGFLGISTKAICQCVVEIAGVNGFVSFHRSTSVSKVICLECKGVFRHLIPGWISPAKVEWTKPGASGLGKG